MHTTYECPGCGDTTDGSACSCTRREDELRGVERAPRRSRRKAPAPSAEEIEQLEAQRAKNTCCRNIHCECPDEIRAVPFAGGSGSGPASQGSEDLVRALRQSARHFERKAATDADPALAKSYQRSSRQCAVEAAEIARRLGGDVYFRQLVLAAVSELGVVLTVDEVVRGLVLRRVVDSGNRAVSSRVAAALKHLWQNGAEVTPRTRLRDAGAGEPGEWREPLELTGPPDVVEVGYTRGA